MITRKAIGEVLGAAMLLGAAGAVSVIMLSAHSDQTQVLYGDLRSHLDLMRAQAVEQVDVTGVEWRTGSTLTFFVVNYGDHHTTYPFEVYFENGTRVATLHDVNYLNIGDTLEVACTAAACTLYDRQLEHNGAIRVDIPSWGGDSLILVTDTGRSLWVEVN